MDVEDTERRGFACLAGQSPEEAGGDRDLGRDALDGLGRLGGGLHPDDRDARRGRDTLNLASRVPGCRARTTAGIGNPASSSAVRGGIAVAHD